MKIITVDEAREGLILARPVEDRMGRTLLRKGEVLTSAIIDRLESFGIQNLSIQTEIESVPSLVAEAPDTPDTKRSVRIATEIETRFRHHSDNPRMQLLKMAALSSLLQKDKNSR
ncbi:MAG: hypothetical protein QF752_02550 [Planctomycetota bacterium]|jgi:hypothetical protein|nr:hypothetical protein [Planctomycetota bacterium]